MLTSIYSVSKVEENLGMAMVFTVVSAVQEKIDTLLLKAAEDKVELRERLAREHEEAERVRGHFYVVCGIGL